MLVTQPFATRFFCPWNFPGKNSGVGCHFLLQGFFPTQGSNLRLLHWQVDSLWLERLRYNLWYSDLKCTAGWNFFFLDEFLYTCHQASWSWGKRVSWGYFLFAVSLAAEHHSKACRLQWPHLRVEHGLSCSVASGIFQDQGLNPCAPCIGRQILNHWTTSEVFEFCPFLSIFSMESRGVCLGRLIANTEQTCFVCWHFLYLTEFIIRAK